MPLSMTQPLPMEALQMGLHRANQMGVRGNMGHVGSNNRLESIANDYANWGITPPSSPTYPGISPFGSYQQFSPLPHHPAAHQAYPGYPFSATAPDLSAALNVSPYAMSPPTFSNTVNVGHLLPEQNANFQQSAGMQPQHHQSAKNSSGLNSLPNQMWPQTSAEMSSAIDRELFGFGLDSQQSAHNGYQHFQPPYFPSANQMGHHGAPSESHGKSRSTGSDILNFINSEKYGINSEKYGSGDKQSLKPIREMDDHEQQAVRPKINK